MKKVILTDVDGVLLNWESNLLDFLIEKENVSEKVLMNVRKYIETFSVTDFKKAFSNNFDLVTDYNNSIYSKSLTPLPDAQDIINNIKNQYDIIAITAMGTSKEAISNREENLEKYFPNAIKEIRFVDLNQSKKDHFIDLTKKYGENIICYVDDASYNSQVFHEVNKNATNFYMNRYREAKIPTGNIKIVDNWYEISDQIKLENKKVKKYKI